jgi:hypothetical protein
MRTYITICVITQAELEFLKLYKFRALLPPDVTNNEEEKQVIAARYLTCREISCCPVLFAAWGVQYWPIKMKL